MESEKVASSTSSSSSKKPSYSTHQRLGMPLCPDTLEYIPEQGIVLAASYHLDKETGVKKGALDLMNLLSSSSHTTSSSTTTTTTTTTTTSTTTSSTLSLRVDHTTPDAAVFDARLHRVPRYASTGTTTTTPLASPSAANTTYLVAIATSGATVSIDEITWNNNRIDKKEKEEKQPSSLSLLLPSLQRLATCSLLHRVSSSPSTTRSTDITTVTNHEDASKDSNSDNDTDDDDTQKEGDDTSPLSSALYVDWLHHSTIPPSSAPTTESQINRRLVASTSDGYVSILDFSHTPHIGDDATPASFSSCRSSLSPVCEWRAHALFGSPIEVWVAVAHPTDPNIVWTGGDDATFKAWDIRTIESSSGNNHTTSSSSTTTVNNKNKKRKPSTPLAKSIFTSNAHTSGVTHIAWHPRHEHLVATGSYDERVLLWDQRMLSTTGSGTKSTMSTPLCEFETGGGVWRLKWCLDSTYDGYLAAACMYNGVHILHVDGIRGTKIMARGDGNSSSDSLTTNEKATFSSDSLAISSVIHYQEHKSIAYGIDWIMECPNNNAGDSDGDTTKTSRSRESGDNLSDIIATAVVQERKPILISCSFYDREVHVWSTGIPLL